MYIITPTINNTAPYKIILIFQSPIAKFSPASVDERTEGILANVEIRTNGNVLI